MSVNHNTKACHSIPNIMMVYIDYKFWFFSKTVNIVKANNGCWFGNQPRSITKNRRRVEIYLKLHSTILLLFFLFCNFCLLVSMLLWLVSMTTPFHGHLKILNEVAFQIVSMTLKHHFISFFSDSLLSFVSSAATLWSSTATPLSSHSMVCLPACLPVSW